MEESMQRGLGFLLTGMVTIVATGRPLPTGILEAATVSPAVVAMQDVRELLVAARGVSPVLCALAADAVWGFGWRGGWDDAPSTPLGSAMRARIRDLPRDTLETAEVRMLLDSLATDDVCVRELSVRLLGRQGGETVASGLIERLGSSVPSMREIAALDLGLTRPR